MKRILYGFIGVLLIAYIIAVNIKSGTRIAFSMPVILIGSALILYAFLRKSIEKAVHKRNIYEKIFKIIKIGIAALLGLLIVIEGIIIGYPKHDTSNSDYIVVLGAGLRDGYYPSAMLRFRLNAAMECINDKQNAGKIVVSGGQGKDEEISEAKAMKDYLIENGVPEQRILAEDESKTTFENFKYSKEVIEKDSGKSIDECHIKIVTTDFHAFRANLIASRNGYENATSYSCETVWYLIPVSYFRESFAVVKSILFD